MHSTLLWFYGFPEAHKPNIPPWPIFSACDRPTDHVLSYVTHFVQPLAEILVSYIQNSKHFLQLIESLPPLPENAILVLLMSNYFPWIASLYTAWIITRSISKTLRHSSDTLLNRLLYITEFSQCYFLLKICQQRYIDQVLLISIFTVW